MKKSAETNITTIEKIQMRIIQLKELYEMYDISNAQDLEDIYPCHLAVTQLITVLYQCRQRLTDEALAKVPTFSKIKLRVERNIASHDYDSLDFKIIYERVCKLLSAEVTGELEVVKDDLKRALSSD